MARNYGENEPAKISKSVLDDATGQVDEVRQDARNRYEGHMGEAKRLEALATEHRQAAQAWQSVFEPGPVDPMGVRADLPDNIVDHRSRSEKGPW